MKGAGRLEVLFILGAKAMSAVATQAAETCYEAKKYPEGTGVRLELKKARKISALKKLAAIKVANLLDASYGVEPIIVYS